MSGTTATGAENRIWFDDFASGFSIGQIGSGEKWRQFESGAFCPADAIATVDENGLRIVPKGVNPVSGEPAFTQTVAPAPPDAEIPGVVDHVKWLAIINQQSSSGHGSFDTVSGKEIYVEACINGRTFGTEGHPFGAAVQDAQNDIRLGTPALVTMDPETGVVFNFFLTNTTIYAVYERAPFSRDVFGNYAGFSFAVPVASREPDDWHGLAVSYDRDANMARWFVDGELALEVDRVGRLLDRRYMAIDVGGSEQEVQLNQLLCGLGMFTLLDASLEGGPGLVDLYGYPMFFCTASGEPTPVQFVKSESTKANRLFGQGAELRCKSVSVSYR